MYSTAQGDTWDKIALKSMGSEKYMHLLIEANYDYRETVVFSAGCLLKIPSVPNEIEADNLPPWKRGNL